MKLYQEFLAGYDEEKIKKEVNVAGAVIMKKNENGDDCVLLIQRSSDDHFPLHFETPRGKCDKGDKHKLIQCLKREVKEETGLDVIPIKFIDKFDYIADRGTRKSTQFNYLCKMVNPNQKVKLSKEHQDYKWISSVGEAEVLCLPEIKKTISKVLNRDKKIINYPKTKTVIGEHKKR